jgi:hypothetical protein
MNPYIKNFRLNQFGAAALAAICFFHIGCRRESDSADKQSEPAPAETTVAASAAPVVVNPSFEQGADGKPSGWTGTGNVVWGEGEGATGARFAALRSDDGAVNNASKGGEPDWRSEPVSLVPGTAYELRFRCRYRPEVLFTSSQVYAGPECARQLIKLDASEVVSPFRSYSVRFVAPAEPQRIFLGAFQLKGVIEYDDIELFPIKLAQSSVDGMLLEEGETITGNRYNFNAPFENKALRNLSRALVSCNNVFHHDRWRFSKPTDVVVYRHELAGRKQLSGELSLTTWFHEESSWALGVEVSTDGKDFRRIATFKKPELGPQKKTEKVKIPADMLPASALWVRLCNDTTDNSKPMFFQVPKYEYSANIDGAPLQAVGQTAAMTMLGEDPAISVQPLVADVAKPAFSVKVTNLGNKTVQLSPELSIRLGTQSEKKSTAAPMKLAPGKTSDVSIPYEMPEAGNYAFEFSLGKNSSTRLAATIYQPILNATNYGELLNSPSPGVGLWWASSGWKVSKTRPLPTAKSQAIRISLAGNEAEGAQLVVRPEKALTGLTATAGELRSNSGALLPADAVEVLRVGYVNVEMPTDEPNCTGNWPDPLPPFKGGVSVAAGDNQPLWVRVKAPANTAPGLYRGQITLKAEGFTATVPLEVQVYGFSLPDTTTCRTLFGLDAGPIWRYQRLQTDADKRAVWEKYLRLMSDNRISPYNPVPLDMFTWKFSGGSNFWSGGKVVADQPRAGTNSLLVEDASPTESLQVSSSEPLPISGKALDLNLWYRTEKADQPAQLLLSFSDSSGSHLGGKNIHIDLSGATEWTNFTKTIGVIPSGAVSMKFSLQASPWTASGENIGKAWFDDLSLTDTGNGKELIADGGMEVGNAAGDKKEIVFDWKAWDAAMARVFEKYHFNSFVFGGESSFPGLGGGTFHSTKSGEFEGHALGTQEHRELFRAWCSEVRSHLVEKGWLDKAVSYPFDEPAEKDYPAVIERLKMLKENFPGLRRMVPVNLGTAPEFIGYIDYWCPILSAFDATFAHERQKAGDIFTWYICCGPVAPYIGNFIDRPATDMRVWLWQTWQNEVQGILIWRVNWWNSKSAYPDSLQNPYLDSMSWIDGYGKQVGEKRRWNVGDGRFIYPPEACFDGGQGPVLDGPVSTIRLEAQRDGIEDYEYLVLLKRLLGENESTLNSDEAARYAKLLEVPASISSGLTTFTTDPAPIAARRHELANAIEKLTNTAPITKE